jgi:serine phosphatase RsbU (regulator of sigma subunit)
MAAMISAAAILNARILIVDDKEANVLLLEGMLRIAGYMRVHSTTNPREVCDLHRLNHYGLILLDLQMPGMDGFEVMEGLKHIETDGYMPVIVITAQPDHKLRALEAGAKDFVSKPFDLAELRARVHNILEVRLYSEALARTVRELEITREALRVTTLEETRLREVELSLAQKTQESLLPGVIPTFENYTIHAFSQPTRYVGGDFYDFLPLDSGNWLGILADVSGKGMPAALLSSMVLGALNLEFSSGKSASEVLGRVNRLVCEKSLSAQFVTLFLFLLNRRGEGEFISAAHNPGYIYRSATGEIEELVSDAYFLGMFTFATWKLRRFHLDPGDILVVYSDGLTDAENSGQDSFGEKRLRDVIRGAGPAGGNAVEAALHTALDSFTGGAPQTDDITFIVVSKNLSETTQQPGNQHNQQYGSQANSSPAAVTPASVAIVASATAEYQQQNNDRK